MKKYSSQGDWKRADALIRKRKVNGKDTEILMNGKLVSAKNLKRELGRYAWQQPYGQQPSGERPSNPRLNPYQCLILLQLGILQQE